MLDQGNQGGAGARRDLSLNIVVALMSVVGTGVSYVIPYYLLGLQSSYHLPVGQLGFIPGSENLCIGIGCILTGFLLRKAHARAVLIAAALCVLGDLLSLSARDFVSIFAVRSIVGLVGEGPLYAISYMVVGAALNPDRTLGVAMTALGVFGAGILMFADPLAQVAGPAAVLLPFAAAGVALVWLVWRDVAIVRVRPAADPRPETRHTGRIDMNALAIIASVVLLTGLVCAMSAFTGTAAQASGVHPADIGQVLSIGLILGLVGSVVPAIIGNRFGRLLPVALCSLGLIVACMLLVSGGGVVSVAAAAMIIQFSWGMNAVYQLSGLVSHDTTGRYATLGAVAQMAGMAVGPPVLGAFIAAFGYSNLPLLAAGVCVPGLALFILGSTGRFTRLGPHLAAALPES